MLKKIFYILDLILPRFIARTPYNLALITLKLTISNKYDVQIWPRHSFQLKTFVFGISDLDLTFLNKTYNSVEQKEVLSIFNFWKKIFLFLGEINFYSKDSFESLSKVANFFEVSRDPLLKELISVSPSSEIHHFVFLLRNFLADKKNLSVISKSRQKKWNSHFKMGPIQAANIVYFTDTSIVEILGQYLSNKDPQHADEWRETFLYILNFKEIDYEFYHGKRPFFVSVLLPHLTIWTKENLDALEQLNDFHKNIIFRQLEWEIWGLYGQHPLLNQNDAQVIEHLKKLQQVAIKLNNSQLIQSFQMLIDLWLKNLNLPIVVSYIN